MALVPKFPAINNNQEPAKLFETSYLTKYKETINNNNNKHQLFPKCIESSNQRINYSIENTNEKPNINFKQLEWLIDIDKKYENKSEAHEIFMKNYNKIFDKEKFTSNQLIQNYKNPIAKKLPANESKLINGSLSDKQLALVNNSSNNNNEEINNRTLNDISHNEEHKSLQNLSNRHNIRFYIEKIHNKKSEIEDPWLKKIESLKNLKKLVKKYPFERVDHENNEIYEILTQFEEFTDLFSSRVKENTNLLKNLCANATFEIVSSKYTPVFGNFAFYLILKGTVKPLSIPHLNKYHMKLRVSTPEPDNPQILGVGSCFGTIVELKGRDLTTRMFRALTLEDKCEFLKISIDSYNRVTQKIQDEERLEKFNAIKNSKSYSSWPKHTIEELMSIFEWRDFSASTILTSEGYKCPFIGFIVKGSCHVLRKVDIPVWNKKTKEKEKRMKQVVMGSLNETDSFGEVSVTMREPMTCSIVTETSCKIGIIPCDKISKLDNITLRLLLQTNNRTFSDFTEEQIHKKFIEQEKKKEWKEFKNNVILNVMDKYGIVYGTGKYPIVNEQINSDN